MMSRIFFAFYSFILFNFVTSQNVAAAITYLFDHNKYVKEVRTNSQLLSIIRHLGHPNDPSPNGYTLKKSDRLYLIIYYADWCPHCHKTAPIWSNVASYYHCTPGVQFFAFECSVATQDRIDSDGVNPLEACQNQTVTGYPTMMAYWSGNKQRSSNTTTTGLVINSNEEDFGITEFNQKRLVAADDNNPLVLSGNSMNITTTTISVHKEPINIAIRSFQNIVDWIAKNTYIKDAKKCMLPSTYNSLGITPSNDQKKQLIKLDRWPKISTCPDKRLHDALSGFLYLLQNWVIQTDVGLIPSRNKELQALIVPLMTLLPGFNIRSSLFIFYRALHVLEDQIIPTGTYHGFVNHIDLGGIRAKPVGIDPDLFEVTRLPSATWLLFHIMSVSLLAQSHPTQVADTFKKFHYHDHCPKQQQQHQVPPINIRQNQRAIDSLRSRFPMTPWTLAKSIRTTVSNFFECEICRVHFIKFFDSCYGSLCDWVKDTNSQFYMTPPDSQGVVTDSYEGMLLWLWRFHNAVTFRTAVERSADSIVSYGNPIEESSSTERFFVSYENQDVRFPSKSLCPKCRRTLQYNVLDHTISSFNSPDAFSVSKEILEKAVHFEKVMRGIETAPDNILKSPFNDSTWDRIEDYNLRNVLGFLIQFLWKLEWSNVTSNLTWDSNSLTFNISSNITHQQRRLAGSVPSIAVAGLQLYPSKQKMSQSTNNGLICLIGLGILFLTTSVSYFGSKGIDIVSKEFLISIGLGKVETSPICRKQQQQHRRQTHHHLNGIYYNTLDSKRRNCSVYY